MLVIFNFIQSKNPRLIKVNARNVSKVIEKIEKKSGFKSKKTKLKFLSECRRGEGAP